MTRFDKQEIYCICLLCIHHNTHMSKCHCKKGFEEWKGKTGEKHEIRECHFNNVNKFCVTVKKM